MHTRATQKHAYKDYTWTHTRANIHTMAYTLNIGTYKDRNNSEKNRTVTRINTDRTSETDGEVEY